MGRGHLKPSRSFMINKSTGGGNFKREQVLGMLPDNKLKISAEHFRRVVRRIESIRPEQDGNNAVIKVIDNPNGKPGRLIKFSPDIFELNVCRNGNPSIIKVYGINEDQEP